MVLLPPPLGPTTPTNSTGFDSNRHVFQTESVTAVIERDIGEFDSSSALDRNRYPRTSYPFVLSLSKHERNHPTLVKHSVDNCLDCSVCLMPSSPRSAPCPA